MRDTLQMLSPQFFELYTFISPFTGGKARSQMLSNMSKFFQLETKRARFSGQFYLRLSPYLALFPQPASSWKTGTLWLHAFVLFGVVACSLNV